MGWILTDMKVVEGQVYNTYGAAMSGILCPLDIVFLCIYTCSILHFAWECYKSMEKNNYFEGYFV